MFKAHRGGSQLVSVSKMAQEGNEEQLTRKKLFPFLFALLPEKSDPLSLILWRDMLLTVKCKLCGKILSWTLSNPHEMPFRVLFLPSFIFWGGVNSTFVNAFTITCRVIEY